MLESWRREMDSGTMYCTDILCRGHRALFGQLASSNRASGIRPLQPSRDLGELASLIEQAFGQELSQGGEQVLRELRLLARLGPLSVLLTGVGSDVQGLFNGFVWEQEGRVVGNVTVSRPTRHPSRWQISNVAVLESYRRRGIGRKLVEAAIDLILHRGGHTAYLFVRPDNMAATHLYESLGFVQVDRSTDLAYVPGTSGSQQRELGLVQQLRAREAESLYELASQAMGAGSRWLAPVRRRHFVRSVDERLYRWLGAQLTAAQATFWGAFATDSRLRAGLSLRATRLWNPGPHKLKLWIHPGYRGQLEDLVAEDVMTLLWRSPRRRTQITLAACEDAAVDALQRQGFSVVRSLALMKLEL